MPKKPRNPFATNVGAPPPSANYGKLPPAFSNPGPAAGKGAADKGQIDFLDL